MECSLSSCLLNCLCLLICNCLFRILFVFVKIKHSQLANPAISMKVESGRTTLGEPWNTSRPSSRLLKNLFFLSLWLFLAKNFRRWPLYRDGRIGLSFHWTLWTANIAKSSCHNSFFCCNFSLQVLVLAVFGGWSSSADSLFSLNLKPFNNPSVQSHSSLLSNPLVLPLPLILPTSKKYCPP